MATSFLVRFGRHLQALRQKRGLSQTQLADMADVNREQLSRIENGVVAARLDTLYAIATALEIKVGDLFKGL